MTRSRTSSNLNLGHFRDLSRLNILLVEDVAFNQVYAIEMLQELGLTVEIASNGEEAVSMVKKKRYDVILMDIEMPVMDGLEACRTIRALGDHYASIPIIAMTSQAMPDSKEKCLQAGMNYFLTKPFDANQVVQTLFKIAA